MINSIEDLRSGGVLPSGPVSAWPQSRNAPGPEMKKAWHDRDIAKHDTQVKAGLGDMAKGLVKVAAQAVSHGRVSEEIREERMETCRQCPHFIEDSKRCSECGCFMEAKSWVGGDPKGLCPKAKWVR
jgi:hypothetical protein